MVSYASSDQGHNDGLRTGGPNSPGTISTEGTEGENEEKKEETIQSDGFSEEVSDQQEDKAVVNRNTESVESESSNKYNFIFYFLYKFKYGEAQEDDGALQSIF